MASWLTCEFLFLPSDAAMKANTHTHIHTVHARMKFTLGHALFAPVVILTLDLCERLTKHCQSAVNIICHKNSLPERVCVCVTGCAWGPEMCCYASFACECVTQSVGRVTDFPLRNSPDRDVKRVCVCVYMVLFFEKGSLACRQMWSLDREGERLCKQ